MTFASHNTTYPQHFFPQAWSAQDLADAFPLRLFEAVDFNALIGTRASNAAAPRAWRRRYADAGALPAQVRVR